MRNAVHLNSVRHVRYTWVSVRILEFNRTIWCLNGRTIMLRASFYAKRRGMFESLDLPDQVVNALRTDLECPFVEQEASFRFILLGTVWSMTPQTDLIRCMA